MEVPTGFEPVITELQSIALATWLRDLKTAILYYHILKLCQDFLGTSSTKVSEAFFSEYISAFFSK